MADMGDVRKIAMVLPGTVEVEAIDQQVAFSVPSKKRKGGYAWTWKERLEPKKPRVPNPNVIALRTADIEEKETLLAMHPDVLFTEPHYNGFPAVLVRLEDVGKDLLAELITDAWRSQADKDHIAEYESQLKQTG